MVQLLASGYFWTCQHWDGWIIRLWSEVEKDSLRADMMLWSLPASQRCFRLTHYRNRNRKGGKETKTGLPLQPEGRIWGLHQGFFSPHLFALFDRGADLGTTSNILIANISSTSIHDITSLKCPKWLPTMVEPSSQSTILLHQCPNSRPVHQTSSMDS